MSAWSRLRVLAAISLVVPTFVIALAGVPSPAAAAATVVPSQWIAKVYTEGLGRAPDQSAWANMVAFFQSNGCSATTLAQKGEPIYESSEFNGLGYDNAARLLALYRGALDREPDSSGYTHYLGLLSETPPTPWNTVVTDLFTSPEFTSDAATFCTEGSYNFGAGPAITIPLGQSCTGQFCFTGGTQTQLQTMLDNAKATDATVTLAQHVVVSIDTPQTIGPPRTRQAGLDIPSGVTLTTVGQPTPNQYATMGRLVRASGFGEGTTGAAVVEVESGAKLLNVWVDGQRTGPTDHQGDTVNVETASGSGDTVSSDRLSNAIGFTNLHALGTAEFLPANVPCGSTTITGNLVTAYSSSHTNGDWSDGLSVACENATVENNTVIDATDVGIVLFRAYPADQKSTVADNTILNAGNPAFGGIVADPLSNNPPNSPSFAGASVRSNTLWTGPGAYYHIGLSVGSAAWFDSPNNPANIGSGASFTGNTLTASATEAIAVSGMLNATVTGNTLNWTPGQYGRCPQAEIAVDPQDGSGTIQPPVTSVEVRDCIS
ncbi:MAG: hypothetical protein JO345_23480 [Streptosporangiaceae bacterium]|nr:hypothetical protein [Streptosporangiaceae bacterium]